MRTICSISEGTTAEARSLQDLTKSSERRWSTAGSLKQEFRLNLRRIGDAGGTKSEFYSPEAMSASSEAAVSPLPVGAEPGEAETEDFLGNHLVQ
jgi:hypothetical protein